MSDNDLVKFINKSGEDVLVRATDANIKAAEKAGWKRKRGRPSKQDTE